MKGFFNVADLSIKKPTLSLLPQCGSCGLYLKCNTPKMQPSGKGRRKILLLGEAPGENEDRKGIQFIGNSGQYLERVLARVGINMREDCYITNSLICRPEGNKIKDNKQIDFCRPNLIKTIEELKPEIIIPMGAKAVQSLIGWIWKEDVGPVTRWVGWTIPCQKLNTWLIPTWHPSHILRNEGEKKDNPVMKMFFEEHLRKASKLNGRPWEEIPDYSTLIEKIYDTDLVPGSIKQMMSRDIPISFDFENDRLKPEHEDARIICCSLSNGDRTIAFPWQGMAVQAVKNFISSNHPKIVHNCKYEDRWSRQLLNTPVNNIVWDGMLMAHLIDNRKGITSLKFQSFVLLGKDSYDDHLKPLMKTKGGNLKNKLNEIDLGHLLYYCGNDALLAWDVAKKQMETLNYGSFPM